MFIKRKRGLAVDLPAANMVHDRSLVNLSSPQERPKTHWTKAGDFLEKNSLKLTFKPLKEESWLLQDVEAFFRPISIPALFSPGKNQKKI